MEVDWKKHPIASEKRHLDNGFYLLTEKEAKRLCEGSLPRPGWERKVLWGEREWWIKTTIHQGQLVWAMRFIMTRDDVLRSFHSTVRPL